jgi:glucose-6-phosphate 1-dehydrogenase
MGYERLPYDAMMGDATLFQRADMVEAGWSSLNLDAGQLPRFDLVLLGMGAEGQLPAQMLHPNREK